MTLPPRVLFRRPLARLLCGAAALVTANVAAAQTIEEIPLRKLDPSAPPAPPEEIEFHPGGLDDRGFNRVVRRVSVPTLTVYRAAPAGHRGAALVAIAGGGYQGIVIDREGHAIARYFQARGLTVAVLKYRLPQPDTFVAGLPAPQQDALEAIRLLRRRAADWQLDPHRIGVLGASAGGHLAGSAALLGRSPDDSRPDFAVLLYPVVTMAPPFAHAGSRAALLGTNPAPERVREFSLEQNARAGLPPFFVAHARDDKTVPVENTERLAAALRDAGVPVETMIVATGGHGFALGRGRESSEWKDRFLAWLDRLP